MVWTLMGFPWLAFEHEAKHVLTSTVKAYSVYVHATVCNPWDSNIGYLGYGIVIVHTKIVLWTDALQCIVPPFAQCRHCVRLSLLDKSQHCEKRWDRPIDTVKSLQEVTTMLSIWGQRGLEAKIFGLCFVACCLVLVLMQCWPRSRGGCPRGLIVGPMSVIEITSLRYVVLW